MKLNRLIPDMRLAFNTILHFGRHHQATLSMMQGTFARLPVQNEMMVGIDATVTIKPSGSIYLITRVDFVSNIPDHEETWQSVYSYSSGHLIEIGGDRYCFFDTASKRLYLETITELGRTTVEIFIKSFDI